MGIKYILANIACAFPNFMYLIYYITRPGERIDYARRKILAKENVDKIVRL